VAGSVSFSHVRSGRVRSGLRRAGIEFRWARGKAGQVGACCVKSGFVLATQGRERFVGFAAGFVVARRGALGRGRFSPGLVWLRRARD